MIGIGYELTSTDRVQHNSMRTIFRTILAPLIFIWYSSRNYIWYRKPQMILVDDDVDFIEEAVTLQDTKNELTESLLRTVGLRIVEAQCDTIPWYVLLTDIQQRYVRMVSQHGYLVGLN